MRIYAFVFVSFFFHNAKLHIIGNYRLIYAIYFLKVHGTTLRKHHAANSAVW